MKRQEIIDRLAFYQAEVKAMGIETLALFGTVARDEVTPNSDIDLLVTFNRPIGLLHYVRIRRRLSEILGREVDLVTRSALREEMREEILPDKAV